CFLFILPACQHSGIQPVSQKEWNYNPEQIHLNQKRTFTPKLTSVGFEGIHIRSLTIQVEVNGTVAHTRMRMVIPNKHPRDIEATLDFPLPAGSQVNYLALDINGTMREASLVEKEKGRVVFEEVTRQRADPALLEQTDENHYRLRIF